VTGSLTVDKGFGLAQFKALATHLRSLSASNVTFVKLPVTTAAGWRDIHGVSQSVVLLDEARLPAAFAAVAGTATTVASPSASPSATPASSPPAQTATAAAANCAP
jgi:hypothetical protein